MKIRYDAEVDALSIIFLDTTVTSREVAEGIAIEYDREDRVAGIEILDARARFGAVDPLQSITLEGIAVARSALVS